MVEKKESIVLSCIPDLIAYVSYFDTFEWDMRALGS
jgi:hypothetical protein